MATIFSTPIEIVKCIANAAREKRLFLNLSQKTLSERSGVSPAVIKKFESTGKISLESLLKLAFVLDSLHDFFNLFKKSSLTSVSTLDELFKEKSRKRGRK